METWASSEQATSVCTVWTSQETLLLCKLQPLGKIFSSPAFSPCVDVDSLSAVTQVSLISLLCCKSGGLSFRTDSVGKHHDKAWMPSLLFITPFLFSTQSLFPLRDTKEKIEKTKPAVEQKHTECQWASYFHSHKILPPHSQQATQILSCLQNLCRPELDVPISTSVYREYQPL